MHLCKLSGMSFMSSLVYFSGVCAQLYGPNDCSVCARPCGKCRCQSTSDFPPSSECWLALMGKKVVVYFIHEVCIVDEVIFCHPTVRWALENCCIFTRLFTLALHTPAHKQGWRYHFWNGTGGGVWWHLAWELSTLIALAKKKSVEKGPKHTSKTLLGTCCLLYLEQSVWLLDWRPLHLFLSVQPEGNFISLQFFSSKDICHWTFYKSFRPKDSCKTRKREGVRGKPISGDILL